MANLAKTAGPDLGVNSDVLPVPKPKVIQLNQQQPTLGGNGDPVLTDPKVKRFLQQLGTKMVEHEFDGAFKPGDRVIHPYLGMGKVIRVHDPAEADPEGGLLYDVRYPEFDIALNQIELMEVPPPPVSPITVPIKANMRSAIPTAPPHPALQATVAMAPFAPAMAQAEQQEKEAQLEAMKEGAGQEGGEGDEEGSEGPPDDDGGGKKPPPKGGNGGGNPFGKSEAMAKAKRKPAKEPAKALEWKDRHGPGHPGWKIAHTPHGTYDVAPWGVSHPKTGQKGFAVGYTPVKTGPVDDQPEESHSYSIDHHGTARSVDIHGTTHHASVEAAQQAAAHHHATKHYGLSAADREATHEAWPDQGPARYIGAHPETVRSELNRAHRALGHDHLVKKHPAEYEAESAKIQLNARKPENQVPHDFKPAEWTFPNGHPRCLRCGHEERTGGCDPARDGLPRSRI